MTESITSSMVKSLHHCETTIIGEYTINKGILKKKKPDEKKKSDDNEKEYNRVFKEQNMEKRRKKKKKFENFEELDSIQSLTKMNESVDDSFFV